MKRNDFEGYYDILKDLVILSLIASTGSKKQNAIKSIMYSFINYVDTGDNDYLDQIVFTVEDTRVNLPSGLNEHIRQYIDTLASDILELDTL